jgi:hypothetical protein
VNIGRKGTSPRQYGLARLPLPARSRLRSCAVGLRPTARRTCDPFCDELSGVQLTPTATPSGRLLGRDADARATFDRTVHRDKDRSDRSERTPRALARPQPLHLPAAPGHALLLGEENCGEMAADSTNVAGYSGHEDRAAHLLISSALQLCSDDLGTLGFGRASDEKDVSIVAVARRANRARRSKRRRELPRQKTNRARRCGSGNQFAPLDRV